MEFTVAWTEPGIQLFLVGFLSVFTSAYKLQISPLFNVECRLIVKEQTTLWGLDKETLLKRRGFFSLMTKRQSHENQLILPKRLGEKNNN